MNLEIICKQVCELAKETGAFIRKEVSRLKQSDIEIKGSHDFVTYVDKTSEKKIIDALKKIIPEAGFIAEENTIEKKEAKYQWIIDPLDGTTNFIHSVPCFSISIALMCDDVVVLGVVYEINLDECFYAWEKSKAYCNGKEIHVSDAAVMNDTLLATGFPYYDYDRLEGYMKFFVYCLKNTHGLRRIGSAAVDLVYVACGRFDGFFEYSLKPWDVAAGAFIVQRAGGKVFDFSGGNNYIFGKEIIACNNNIAGQMLELGMAYFK
jgi:myo-inositol-1(or 4)-monophosphatase